ncbi:MAG: hypothetical protein HKN73_07180 [Gemmatimonadetes bacterium]|nr:hypothetical protein [Gemmatimonadota bacterium]
MSDQDPREAAYITLMKRAWKNDGDNDVMRALLSGDQGKIHQCFKDVGIDVGDDVTLNVAKGSETKRQIVIPPKVYVDAGSDDPAGKCYGPLCLVLSGPF